MNGMPYIGVRGWTHESETCGIVHAFDSLGLEPTHKFCIIVNVDDFTLIEGERRARERCGNGNTHARLRPPVEDIAGGVAGTGIFVDHPFVLNIVSLDAHEMYVWARLEEVVERCGPLLHGIELGTVWPPVWVAEEFRKRHPSLRLVLRITRDAVRAVGPVDAAATPAAVAARIAQYRGITDVLVNLSGPPEEGGVLFDGELIGRYLRAIRSAAPEVGLVAAGGFGAKEASLKPLDDLLPEFPQLGINGGAAVTNVANRVDSSSAIALYRNAQRKFAENRAAALANEQFRSVAERYARTRYLCS